jgi:beta-lactamase regulating signal transducer with metallopeptidase domain
VTVPDLATLLWWPAKGTLLLLVGWVMTALLRTRPATTRHAVWTVVIAAQLLIPCSSRLAMLRTPNVPLLRTMTTTPPPLPAAVRVTDTRVDAAADVAARVTPFAWPKFIALLWLAGVAVGVLRIAVGAFVVRRFTRHSSPVSDSAWLHDLDALRGELALARAVALRASGRLRLPLTWGIIRPLIIIPADALAWSAAQRRQVLLHELGHVRRLDALTHLVAGLAVSLFWFNPFLLLAAERLRVEAEHACDDFVLRRGGRASAYARTLLGLVETRGYGGGPLFTALSIGRSDIEERVVSLTDARRQVAAVRPPHLLPIVAAMLAMVLPLAALERSDSEPPQALPLRRDAAAVRAQCRAMLVDDSDFLTTSGRLSDPPHPDVYYFFLRPGDGRCIEGSFGLNTRFAADDRDVVALPGTDVFVREHLPNADRALRITAGANGVAAYAYQVDGKARVWDAEGRRWYAALLPEFIRSTSAGAEDRVRRLLAADGLEAVLRELRRMDDGDIRGQYLIVLSAVLPPSERSRQALLDDAFALLPEDRMRAAFLAELATREAALPDSRRRILDAVARIRQQVERKRVLQALAESGDEDARREAVDASANLLPSPIERSLFLQQIPPPTTAHPARTR